MFALIVMHNSVVTGIFLLCEPGEKMTTKFVMFGDELDRCNWYLLPINLQRMYIIFISDTQHPMKLSSYAGILCERGSAEKVSLIVLEIILN